MAGTITIGTATAGPGETARGGIPIMSDMYGRPREIPIIICNGVEAGPILWLNGATHGRRTRRALFHLQSLEQIDAQALSGAVVAVPAMNVDAFSAGTRGDPLDSFAYDMNRLYPGRPDGYPTERIAHAHWRAMKDNCDLQVAIHSGGEHSYLAHMIFASDNPPSLELAAAMGKGWSLVFRQRDRRRQSQFANGRHGQSRHHRRTGRQLPHPNSRLPKHR